MSGKHFLSGDEAVAFGVRLARPKVVTAYPITPQTIVVERLSDYVEDGSLKAEYIHVESEHSAMASAMGASIVGARVFTATSSQGLLYMSEVLHYASGARLPIVMMNANRSVAVPWSIFGDQRDSLSQLDAGWIQVYVEDAQEALDMTIQAYRIAEDPEVLTPVMVNLDGFFLTHTYEVVDVPEQDKVDAFLPPLSTINKFDFDNPKNLCMTAAQQFNTELRYQQQLAMMNSVNIINKADKEYGDIFGRYYGGMLEEYRTDDADAVLITVGSVTATTRLVVDQMRSEGFKVGLMKIRYLRPFPSDEVAALGKKVKAIGVIDKDISFGYEGTIFTNVNSALAQLGTLPISINFIAGLGGRDITKGDIRDMFIKLLKAIDGEQVERVDFLQVGCER